ncbi:retrotransposon protein, putative, ty1-copia subclass [Tanacetum coccineum]
MYAIEQPLPAAPVANFEANDSLKTPHIDIIKEAKLCLKKQAGVEGFPKNAKTSQVMMIKGGKIQKAIRQSLNAKNGKGNNLSVYLAELLKKNKASWSLPVSSGNMYNRFINFPITIWVYDTGCVTIFVIRKQEFREARRLKQGAIYLYVGNGVRAQVEAIGIHCLVENGFVQRFTDFGISVSKNNVHYFNAILSNESAIRILNMVLTKKVDKTPYELCSFRVILKFYGVDYEETFSPVDDIRAIRILISIAAYYDYEIWQMDIKTAFLNGYLGEDIYMVQPEGFVDPNHPRKVCKLQRSIYGLKQASRSWNKRFDEEIKRLGFAQNLDEPCVYQKASGSKVIFLILYVDDIIIMGNHIPSLQSVKDYLGKCFAMKDLRETSFILEIKI